MRATWILVLFISLTTIVSGQPTPKAFERATRAAKAGDYRKALTQYQKALEQYQSINASSADFTQKIHYNIGVCFFRLSRPVQAIEEYAKAIESSNGNYQKAFRAKAMAEVELKNWSAARKDFDEALRLNQHDGESWFDLAMVLICEKDYDSAAEAFRKAIENQSSALAASHNNLGVILALKTDFRAAEKEFEAALFESKGAFAEAQKNLEFCRTLSQKPEPDLTAKLEFSLKN